MKPGMLRMASQGDGARRKALARLRGKRRIALASQLLNIAHERTRLEYELAVWRTKAAQAATNMRLLENAAETTQRSLARLDGAAPKPKPSARPPARPPQRRGATIIEY